MRFPGQHLARNMKAREANSNRRFDISEAIDTYRAGDDGRYVDYDRFPLVGSETDPVAISVRGEMQVTAEELKRWRDAYDADAPNREIRYSIQVINGIADDYDGEVSPELLEEEGVNLAHLTDFVRKHGIDLFETRFGVDREELARWTGEEIQAMPPSNENDPLDGDGTGPSDSDMSRQEVPEHLDADCGDGTDGGEHLRPRRK